MNILFDLFEKFYPCKCRKAAALSSAALTVAVVNFCNQLDTVSHPKEITQQKTAKRKT